MRKTVCCFLACILLVPFYPLAVTAQGARGHIPLVAQLDFPKSAEWAREDLEFVATHYRGISDRSVNFSKRQIEFMKRVNPDFFVLKYLSATTVHGRLAAKVIRHIPGAALYDHGNRPEPPLWNRKSKGILFNPAHPRWHQYLIRRSKAYRQKGYDGIMLDECLMANHLPKDFSGINPVTGSIYTTYDFRRAVFGCLRKLRWKLGPDFLLIANSVAYGSKYWQEGSRKFLEVVDGVIAEGFRGPSSWPNNRLFKEDGFRKNIEMLMDVEKAGKYCIVMVKYEQGGIEKISPSRKKELDLFHLVCFLMGKGSKSMFVPAMADSANRRPAGIDFNFLWNIEPGIPSGYYYKKHGIYQRDFTRAKVLANPSARTCKPVLRNGEVFFSLEGRPVKDVFLKPFSGMILLRYQTAKKPSAN